MGGSTRRGGRPHAWHSVYQVICSVGTHTRRGHRQLACAWPLRLLSRLALSRNEYRVIDSAVGSGRRHTVLAYARVARLGSPAARASTSERPRSCRMASSLDSGGRDATETERTSALAARVSSAL